MWKLFKETFKSLRKNKVTVIGLTILVFLSSAIFTLLYDVSKSINNQYVQYKDKSKLHDLTLDLNIPSSGNAYNNGYFVNGLTKDKIENYESYDKPLIYKNSANFLQTKFVLNLDSEKQKYIKLEKIGVTDSNFKDLYFAKDDLYDLYNFFNVSKLQSTVDFDLDISTDPSKKPRILFKRDYKINTYKFEKGTFVLSKNENRISGLNNVKLDKDYKFSDIFRVRKLSNNSIIFTEPSTLFINTKTHEATFNYEKGREWDDNSISYKLPIAELANSFGLKIVNPEETIFKLDETITKPTLLSSKIDLSNVDASIVKKEFIFNTVTTKEISKSEDNLFVFLKDKTIEIPKNFVAKEEIETTYQRWNYTTTFLDGSKDKWSGSYKTFMETINAKNDPLIQKLNNYSHWAMGIDTFKTHIDEAGNLLKREHSSSRKNYLTISEINTLPLTIKKEDQPKAINYINYDFSGTKTIFEIEKLQNLNKEIVDDINDAQIRDKRFSIIKDGALKITKDSIKNEVVKNVGEVNLGIRKTLTVDAVNANTNKKQVFHFINTGNENNVIEGTKINVGKLYNVQIKPTAINNISEVGNSYFKTKELPIFVSYVLIKNAPFNLTPNPELTKLDFTYEQVNFVNPKNGENEIKNGIKVYKLTDYKNEDTHPEINVFNSYGIAIDNINFSLVYYNEKNKVKWETITTQNKQDLHWTAEEILDLFKQQNWTLRVEKMGPNGWVEFDKNFKNNAYLPIGYRQPRAQIVNESINSDSLNFAFRQIQNVLLNSEFVKEGLLSSESIYAFIESATKTAENGLISKIFKTGQMNMSEVIESALTFLYHFSHTNNGDNLTNIINDIIEGIKKKLSTKTDLIERKKYLLVQLNSFFTFMSDLTGTPFKSLINPETLVEASKDPVKVLDATMKLIKSINLRAFSEEPYNFIKSKEYNKVVNFDKVDRKIKFSSSQILIWLFKHIDEKLMKESVIEMIDNLDINSITNLANKNSLINVIINIFPEKIRGTISELFRNINAFPGDKDKTFKNLIDGLKYFINTIDLKLLVSTLEKKLVIRPFTQSLSAFDYIKNEFIHKDYEYLAYSVSNHDIYYALLKSLFNVEGSNKAIKNKIIEMLNLSDKGTVVKVDNASNIIFPASDPDKIDFFDLIGVLTKASSESSTEEKNKITLTKFEETYTTVYKLLNRVNGSKELAYDLLTTKESKLLLDLFGFNKKNFPTYEEIKIKLDNLLYLINLFKFDNNNQNYQNDMLIGNLGKFYLDFNNSNNGNSLWNTAFSFMKEIMKYEPKNSFSYGVDAFALVQVWASIFNVENVNFDRKILFANRLLEISNEKEIVDLLNSFDLIQPSAQNIALSDKTGFGISKSLSNPFAVNNELFKKNNSSYANKLINELMVKFPEFNKWLTHNSFSLTKSMSYIAASQMYYSFTDTDINHFKTTPKYKNLHSIIIDNFINGIMKRDIIKNNQELFSKISNYFSNNNAINLIGVSDVLINPILRQFFPQVLVWTLSDTNNYTSNGEKNSANIAYFINEKIMNFENLFKVDEKHAYDFISKLSDYEVKNPIFETELSSNIAFNNDFFLNLLNSPNNKEGHHSVFGINLTKFLIDIVNSITSIDYNSSSYKFDEPSAYVAKANYAYLSKNNKVVYTGELPTTPTEMSELVNKLDEKFLINVNGLKYIILGDEITADYLYPVIDENNIQVDTSSQALVYVNQNGFDRTRYAYQGNTVKEYLLIKTNPGQDKVDLENRLETFVKNNIDDSAKLQRVYSVSKLDPLNPERTIRVTVIDGIIKSVNSVSTILLSILITLVAISIIFIIKRYINNKNKVIGILLAQGYSPVQISSSFTVFSLVTALIGGTFGYILGFLLQSPTIRILDNYWTLPIVTTNFSWFTLFFTLVLPFIGMSLLIVVTSLWSLRYKSIDLMSGITEVQTGEIYRKYHSKFRNKKITTKFGASLIFNSFWKLCSFALSVILTAITTIFGISTLGVFDKSISKTYENRAYKYKYDLQTPTIEGGALNPYSPDDLEKSLYVTQGISPELKRNNFDYFKPGYSSILNAENTTNGVLNKHPNGITNKYSPHIITQFSINLKVDSGVAVDPWSIAYNSMPDTQKSRITQLRNKMGIELEKTQEGLIYNSQGNLDINKTRVGKGFFRYLANNVVPLDSKFVYMEWNSDKSSYDVKTITTRAYRDEYREFLVKAYKDVYTNKKPDNDFFIAFGGIYFDPKNDEKYTHVLTEFNGNKVSMYGYQKNSQQIKLVDSSGNDLTDELNNSKYETTPYIPLVINEVVSKKFGLGIGSEFTSEVFNKTNRYTNKFKDAIKQPVEKNQTYNFKVIGINSTYINYEFIIPKTWADKITGLDKLDFNGGERFNGILSKSVKPEQLIGSAALYSMSGYWPAFSSFDLNTMEQDDKVEIFENIFGKEGILLKNGYTNQDIAKFILGQDSDDYNEALKIGKANPDEYINKYSEIFDKSLYVPTAYSLIASDIEIGFTKTIAQTVQIIVTAVIILSFIVSSIILILVSSILVSENEKNIAIWTILGYSQKEKLKMFFGIFIPFIVVALIVAIPLALLLIKIFASFLIVSASVSIPITLSIVNIIITFIVIIGIFSLTSILSWRRINKIKAIDLLKGK
ncbi:ABC transporter permease [Mycoplasma crocodyli]|uniref:ABC transporter permease n=1 Tax=Mycoplasma crocodyli TaxID=50052 RepID=UPI00030E9E25|nr:ABC transporter permease [Mycoplasma crocodyli]